MKRNLLRFFVLLVIYLVFAIPFKAMNLIPGFTDVRPVTTLGPIYGIFFGPVGCFVFALGNLIADIIDDALRWSSLAGFSANFFAPYLFWLYWKKFAKRSFCLRTIRDILLYILFIVVIAILETAIIAPAVAIAYPNVNITLFAWSVFGNTTIFPIILGIPIIILMQEELGFIPCVARQVSPETEAR